MSAVKLCRLCLSNDRLIHMFDARLNSQQQLLTCILLGTGVDIRPDDVISKHVCHNCCIISVKLFKYRQNAIACDKALKEYVKQKSEDRPFNKEEIAELNRSLVEGLWKIEPNWTSEDYSESVPAPAPGASNEAPIIKSKSTRGISAVHSSVRRLFRRHPKIVIPNEVLPFDIEATVLLKKDRVYGAVAQVNVEISERGAVVEADLEAIDRLKQTYPSLNITRIKTSAGKDGEEESPKLRRTPAKRRRSSVSEEQEAKQKRASLAPPSEEVKCTSSFTKSDSSVEDHNHFSVENDSGSPPAPSTSANNDPETDENNEANRMVSLCKSCGRIYDCEDELRLHENRMHPVCHVCKEKQRSPAALSIHLSEVCYKNIEANQPKLELARVDEVPELREKYKDVLVYHPNTTEEKDVNDDDDPVEVVNEFDYLSELEFCEEETSGEREFLARIFSKYKGNEAVMKSKHTRMQMSDIKIRYDAKNRIIIENIYSDLKIFKVPLNLKVSATVGAHVSIAPKVKIDDVKETWDSTGAIDIKPKFMSLQGCVVTDRMGVPSLVVSEAARVPGSMQQNIVLLQPSMVTQASGPQNVVVRPSTSSSAGVTGGVGKPPNVLRKMYRPVMLKKMHTGAGSSVINMRELFVPKKAPAALSTPPPTRSGAHSENNSEREPAEPNESARVGTGSSGTGAGSSGTGASSSGTGAGSSGTGAGSSGTGTGSSGTGTGSSGTGAGSSGTDAGSSGTDADTLGEPGRTTQTKTDFTEGEGAVGNQQSVVKPFTNKLRITLRNYTLCKYSTFSKRFLVFFLIGASTPSKKELHRRKGRVVSVRELPVMQL